MVKGAAGTARRDDSAWPTGAFPISVVIAAGGLAVVTYLLVSGHDVGFVAVPFAVMAVTMSALLITAVRGWLRGESIPFGFALASALLGLTGFLLSRLAGWDGFGGGFFSGVACGVGVGNAVAIRMARANREPASA